MNLIKLIIVFTLLVSAALCQVPGAMVVQGVDGKSVTLSASDLSKLPQQTVSTTDHETPATFEGVLLADVLAKVALPAGPTQGRLLSATEDSSVALIQLVGQAVPPPSQGRPSRARLTALK